jgi:5-methylthioadenosine/S-adenosylhomocysteine deaminase
MLGRNSIPKEDELLSKTNLPYTADLLRESSTSEHVDLLVLGPDIVTFDDEDSVIASGAIAVNGNTIVWLGPEAEATRRFAAKETLHAKGMIAMPGLTDGHVHTAQQFLHGKLSSVRRHGELRKPIWQRYLVPFESGLEPEDVYSSGLACYSAMIACGTTCFLEAGGPFPDEMGRAASDIGIRGRIAMSTMDMDDTVPAKSRYSTEEALRRSEELVLRWQGHPRVNAWLSLRQLLVNTEALRVGMRDLSHALDTPIHTHLAEGTYEIDFTVRQWRLRPAEYLASIDCFDHYVHAAHSVLLSQNEIDLYAKHDVSACHCALNNYRIGTPRLYEMVRRNVRVALGSDGAATRSTLDLFEVVHGAQVGAQAVSGTPYHWDTPLSCEQLLRLAVRGGARAARLEHQIGSLETGKLADIVLIDTSDYDQFPVLDPVITLAESTTGRDVRHVIIDGNIVMRDRRLLTIDVDAMRRQVSSRYQVIMSRFDEAIR